MHLSAAAKPNRFSMLCTESRQFAVAVQLVRKRGVADVKQLMAPPLTLEQAVQRVKAQVGLTGGQ